MKNMKKRIAFALLALSATLNGDPAAPITL
jgi:hypothetical protein